MLVKEFRIILPLKIEEYRVGQLFSVAEASKNETGGGEGIEIVTNEPRTFDEPLFQGKFDKGQYTYKIFHLQSKVPQVIRSLAPKGSLEVVEEAWNAYPYCKTVFSNSYMKDKFRLSIETMHLDDCGETENAHSLTPEELEKREVIYIDIANDPVRSEDYKTEEDPTKFHSSKTGRGPLSGAWRKSVQPVMCAYKLVRCEFVWHGLQTRMESIIMKSEHRIFSNFYRQVFCWIDKWHGLTMEDIRAIEDVTKKELDEARSTGTVKGMTEK